MALAVNINLNTIPEGLAETFLQIKDAADAIELGLPDLESEGQRMRISRVQSKISEFEREMSAQNEAIRAPFIREIEEIKTSLNTYMKEDLLCGVCAFPWTRVQATALKCGHLVCTICQKNPDLRACPSCREPNIITDEKDEITDTFKKNSLLNLNRFRRLYAKRTGLIEGTDQKELERGFDLTLEQLRNENRGLQQSLQEQNATLFEVVGHLRAIATDTETLSDQNSELHRLLRMADKTNNNLQSENIAMRQKIQLISICILMYLGVLASAYLFKESRDPRDSL